MAAAYHVFKFGVAKGITKTGLTNPEIMKTLPHGNPPGEAGVVNKTPGAISPVTGR